MQNIDEQDDKSQKENDVLLNRRMNRKDKTKK